MKKINFITLAVALLLISVAIAGCSLTKEGKLQQATSLQSQKDNAINQGTESKPSISDVPNNWKIYENSKYHFSVKFPPSWEYIEKETPEKDVVSNIEYYNGASFPDVFSLTLAKDVKATTIDTGIEISVYKPGLAKSAGYEPVDISPDKDNIVSKKEIIIGGKKAIRYETKTSFQKTYNSPVVEGIGITYVFKEGEYEYSIGTLGVPNEDVVSYMDNIFNSFVVE